ncbi:MAG: hypothetical protein ACYCX4_18435, partial [Bacillota bacterium]
SLILGRKDLVEACAANSCPNHSIGRPMKVDKETIIGLVKAIELYLRQDFEAEMARWKKIVQYFVNALSDVSGIKVWYGFPSEPGIQPAGIPRTYVEIDETAVGFSIEKIQNRFLKSNPGIAVGTFEKGIVLNPQMLEDGEEKVIVDHLKAILQRV